jgi:chromosome segregation ATPase
MALRAESPEDGLAQLEAIREEAQKRKRAVEAEVIRKKRQIEAQQEQLKAELQAQMAEAERALAPLREVMAQLEEGIWTVGLYLGEK